MRLVQRLAALALTLGLMAGNAAICAGWMPTPEARMACCAEGGECEDECCSPRAHEAPQDRGSGAIRRPQCGQSLRSFWANWSHQLQIRRFSTAQGSFDADGAITSFAILQTAPEEWPTIRPHRLSIGFYDLDGDALGRIHRVELDVAGERTEVPELVGRLGAAVERELAVSEARQS